MTGTLGNNPAQTPERTEPRHRPEDAPPKVHRQMLEWFLWYARRYVAKHFHRLLVCGTPLSELRADRPLVIYLNHPAWWDPMIGMVLSSLLPGRRHYCPIDEVMLRKYGIFGKLGFFGVEQGTSRGSAQFLRRSRAILADSNNALWITAQGEFTDPRQRPVKLKPGLGHLIRRLERGVIVPIALEYDFWQERTPEALVRVGEPLILGPGDGPARSLADWQHEVERRLERTQDELAELAIRRDPSAFTSLLSGKTGVGWFYDTWRRLRAALSGKRFDPSHESRP